MSSMYRLPESNKDVLASAWQQFLNEFATEEACFKELDRRIRVQSNRKCRYCGNVDLTKSDSYRVLKCRRCRKRTWITSGGFFHRMRYAKPWLARIWFMERGVPINSLQFAKLAGIASSTALTIFRKLTIVVEDEMEGERVPSSLFCDLLAKRSRETPARGHPLSEQEELERNLVKGGEVPVVSTIDEEAQPKLQGASALGDSVGIPISQSCLSGGQKIVHDCLSQEPIHFDSLCQQTQMKVNELSAMLTMLELDGHAKRLVGDRYIRADTNQAGSGKGSRCDRVCAMEATNSVRAIIDFVRVTFHGISRKYLQNYLAGYWCLMDRVRWRCGSLLEACIGFRYIGYGEILQYVSPYLVKIASTQLA